MVAKFDANLAIYENWQAADDLNSAWFQFAPADLKNQYRESGDSDARTAAIRHMMKGEVRHMVGNQELIAFGIQIKPSLGIGPEHIPAMMFASGAVKIYWEKSEIEGLGRVFGDVRICAPITENADIAESELATVTKRGGGRNDIYPLARIVLAELCSENPAYLRFSAEKLEPVFNERYLKQFSTPDLKRAPVSTRSLRDYIKQYRQELAETGTNQIAN